MRRRAVRAERNCFHRDWTADNLFEFNEVSPFIRLHLNQGMLHPNELALYGAERGICMSIAVSIQDVCKINPDRGVDIILSVAACIENCDPLVQFVGLQSLAHLCEADVIAVLCE